MVTPVAPQLSATPVPISGPPVIERPLSATSPAVGSPGAGLRTAGVVTAAVGGAVLVTGIVLNLKVNSMASDFQNLNGYTDSKESDRKNLATLAWVSYGLGAACVATGSVLYVLGLRGSRQGSTSIAFAPGFGPGGAVALLKGAF